MESEHFILMIFVSENYDDFSSHNKNKFTNLMEKDMKNNEERTLAYKSAVLISSDDLMEVGGGAASGTTVYSTSQTMDNQGNFDVGADVKWD